jgi:predicted molibdopterin-dependent oxidoreductase YjgC
MFMTETAQLADVVFPACSFAEKNGAFTNSERRVQLVRQAIAPIGESKDDAWIVSQLAQRLIALGAAMPAEDALWAGWDYASAADVLDEINALTPIYGGITHERLTAGEQLRWPTPTVDHPGTPILHVGKFSRGLGHFTAVEHSPPDELPDEEYPLMLTNGRVLYHWHGGEMTRRARNLKAMYPEAEIQINPADAQARGIENGGMMKVASRRGEIVAKAQVTTRVPAGLIFATFHYPDSAVNFLTNPALDPVAKIPEYKVCAVRAEAVNGHSEG